MHGWIYGLHDGLLRDLGQHGDTALAKRRPSTAPAIAALS